MLQRSLAALFLMFIAYPSLAEVVCCPPNDDAYCYALLSPGEQAALRQRQLEQQTQRGFEDIGRALAGQEPLPEQQRQPVCVERKREYETRCTSNYDGTYNCTTTQTR